LKLLSGQKLKAFAHTAKPANAYAFYENVLGPELLSEDEFEMEFDANGVLLRVVIVHKLKPHPSMISGWNVNNMAFIIKKLNDKQIFCERYEFPDQDSLGI